MVVFVKEQVLRLEISVGDGYSMKVLKDEGNFGDIVLRQLIGQEGYGLKRDHTLLIQIFLQ